jgi:hypothetical protein
MGTRRFMSVLVAALAVLLSFAAVAFAATVTGDDEANRLRGTKQADEISGLGGDDRIRAGRGRPR